MSHNIDCIGFSVILAFARLKLLGQYNLFMCSKFLSFAFPFMVLGLAFFLPKTFHQNLLSLNFGNVLPPKDKTLTS